MGAASQSLTGNDFTALNAAIGPLTGRRSYQGEADGFPLFSVGNSKIDYDATAHKTKYVTFVSFKPDVIAMANGSLDSQVNAWLASIPSGHPVVATIWHEADGKVRQSKFTVAQFKAAFIRFATLVHQANLPNVWVSLILEAYQALPQCAGTQFADMWPGRGFADLFMVDGYDDLGTQGAVWDGAIQFARTHGVPWAIGEVGTKKAPAVDPKWMADQVAYAGTYDCRAFLWFNNTTSALPTPGSDPSAQLVASTMSYLLYDDPAAFVPWRVVTID